MDIRTMGIGRAAGVLLLGGLAAGCGVDKQTPPPLTGPSGFGQSIALSASPDLLPHDGQSQSVVTLTVRNEASQPMSGVRLSVGASVGTLSHADVVTGSEGTASFIVRAPALSTPASAITVFAVPVGTNADNAVSRTLTIALRSPIANATAPSASFTITPEEADAGTPVAFDASATTDEGQPCASCSYTWQFGDGASASGRVVTHTFATAGAYVVTLTVVDAAGSSDQAQGVVSVIAAEEDEEE